MKKPEPSLNFTIPLKVYPFDVIVSLNEPTTKLARTLTRKGVLDDLELIEYPSDRTGAKYTFFPKYGTALIRLRGIPHSNEELGYLVHEVLHIVIHVLRNIGLPLSDGGESDEAYTYLMNFLVEEIMLKLNKYY